MKRVVFAATFVVAASVLSWPAGAYHGGPLHVGGADDDPYSSGHWRVAADGGVFAINGAHFYGSVGGMALTEPVVGMAAAQTVEGYWLVASDGGIFTFGEAKFHGSTGAMQLNQPIVGMAATPSGNG